MNFIKKQSVGFYLSLLTVIVGIVGLVFYMINCNTTYFRNAGVNSSLVTCLVVGLLLEVGFIVVSELMGEKRLFDILPVVASMLFGAGFIIFCGERIADIATISTLEKNAQTIADLSCVLVGMVCCLVELIIAMIASFFKVVKEEN